MVVLGSFNTSLPLPTSARQHDFNAGTARADAKYLNWTEAERADRLARPLDTAWMQRDTHTLGAVVRELPRGRRVRILSVGGGPQAANSGARPFWLSETGGVLYAFHPAASREAWCGEDDIQAATDCFLEPMHRPYAITARDTFNNYDK